MDPNPHISIKWSVPIRFTDPAARTAWTVDAVFEATGDKDLVEVERLKFLAFVDKYPRV